MKERGNIQRNCLACEKEFKTYLSLNKLYCSKSCAGKSSDKGRFKREYVPWNKGLKGYMAGELHPFFNKKRNEITGENHYNWKGGKSRDKHSLGSHEYSTWRKTILKRDGFKCRINEENCSKQLQVHHILRWSEYPELRYDINNGITLCTNHHPRKRKDEKRTAIFFAYLLDDKIFL